MVSQTVVADVAYTITENGIGNSAESRDPQNVPTAVNGTRDNLFWNDAIFTDARTGIGQRRLVMWTVASGDVGSQTQSASVDELYEPPLTKTCSPATTATITDTGDPTHLVDVETRFEVWDGGTLEFSGNPGLRTTVIEE